MRVLCLSFPTIYPYLLHSSIVASLLRLLISSFGRPMNDYNHQRSASNNCKCRSYQAAYTDDLYSFFYGTSILNLELKLTWFNLLFKDYFLDSTSVHSQFFFFLSFALWLFMKYLWQSIDFQRLCNIKARDQMYYVKCIILQGKKIKCVTGLTLSCIAVVNTRIWKRILCCSKWVKMGCVFPKWGRYQT